MAQTTRPGLLALVVGLSLLSGIAAASEIVHEDDQAIVYLLPAESSSPTVQVEVTQRILTGLVGKGITQMARETLSAMASSAAGVIFSVVNEIPMANPARTESGPMLHFSASGAGALSPASPRGG